MVMMRRKGVVVEGRMGGDGAARGGAGGTGGSATCPADATATTPVASPTAATTIFGYIHTY